MEDIGSAIKYYRELHKLTQKELADKLSISPSTIGMYEQGRRTPDIATLTEMAKLFSITVGYLVGTEKSNGNDYSNFYLDDDVFNFQGKIKEIMASENISENEFLKRTGFSRNKIDSLLFGSYKPNIEDLIKIAGALNVSSDYLLDLSLRKRITPSEELLLSSITPREINLIESYRELDIDNQDILMGKLKELLKEQRYISSVAEDEEPLRKASGK